MDKERGFARQSVPRLELSGRTGGGRRVHAEALPGSVRLGRWARGKSAESGRLPRELPVSAHTKEYNDALSDQMAHLPRVLELTDSKYPPCG